MNRRVALIACLLPVLGPATVRAQQVYEGYYNFLWDYPIQIDGVGWNREAQGLAHDDDFWYIVSNGLAFYGGDENLWKIHVSHPLAGDPSGHPETRGYNSQSVPGLDTEIWDHWGDPDCFSYQGHEYVLVPIDGDDAPCGGLLVFESYPPPGNALVYRGFAHLAAQKLAPWIAVNPQDLKLHSSDSRVGSILRYQLDWDRLVSTGQVACALDLVFSLYNGTQPVDIDWMQGGEFSGTGEHLFLSSGSPGGDVPGDGINVFRTSSTGAWQLVRRSDEENRPFLFQWSTPEDEEPEGLTLWDLDDGRAPGIAGQLHVILLDNDHENEDDVYVKHYTHKIYVDRQAVGAPVQVGTPTNPFGAVGPAAAYAWDGSNLVIRTGSYPESVTIDARTALVPRFGAVVIGE